MSGTELTQIYSCTVTSRHLSPSSLNKSETEILIWIWNPNSPVLARAISAVQVKQNFEGLQSHSWKCSGRIERGKDVPKWGLGRTKGRTDTAGNLWDFGDNEGIMGMAGSSHSVPFTAHAPQLLHTQSLAASLISSDNSSVQIIGCAGERLLKCCPTVLAHSSATSNLDAHCAAQEYSKPSHRSQQNAWTRESCVYSLLHMYTDLGLLVSHMLLSPQRRQKECLWLHHPGGYSPAGSSLSCSILLLVCLLLPEGSKITVEKKKPGLICSSWRHGTHSSCLKCIPEIQLRAPNFRCFCSLYCQCSTSKQQFKHDELHI